MNKKRICLRHCILLQLLSKAVKFLTYSYRKFIKDSQATVTMWKATTQHLCRSWMLPKALTYRPVLQQGCAYVQGLLDTAYLAASTRFLIVVSAKIHQLHLAADN